MSSSIIFLSDCTPLYTTLGAPDRITAVTTYPHDHSVRLEWSPPPNSDKVIVDSYIIRYKFTGAPLTQVLNQVVSFFPTIIISGLSNGESYDFWVVAKNRFGEGPNSPTVSQIPGAPSSGSQIVRRAYHTTSVGTGMDSNNPQKVGLEFTPPLSGNGITPLLFLIKYTRVGSSPDASYSIQDSVQPTQIMKDASGNPAIKTVGVKGNYIRKEITVPSAVDANFVSGFYRFEVFTTNIFGVSAPPDISFVTYLYSLNDARADSIPRVTAPSFTTSSLIPANGNIVSTTPMDSSIRFRWKQYIGGGTGGAGSGGAAYSGWVYRIQYTDDKDYWYYPVTDVSGGVGGAKFPEYTVPYDRASLGADTADFEYFIDISRNVVNGRRYYLRYCVVSASGDTSEYTQITDTNLSITSAIPGKAPNPPEKFYAAVDDRLVYLYFDWENRPPSLELTGGSPPIDYRIERFIVSRAGGVITVPTTPNVVFENLVGPYYEDRYDIRTNGIEYLYRIYTRTAFGYSTTYNSVTAIPTRKSDIIRNVTAEVDNAQITLQWLPPLNIEPGVPIVQYYIEYRVFDILTISNIPPGNIVGVLSGQTTVSNSIQDMNSILVDDTLWSLLTTTTVEVLTYSTARQYTIRGLINNTPYVFRVAAVTQDSARRNLIGLISVIGPDSPYLSHPTVIGKVPARLPNVSYINGDGTITIQWTSTDILNTEGILRFIVDYRVSGSSTYSQLIYDYINAVTYNDGISTVSFSIILSGLNNNVPSQPDTSTNSYEVLFYAENSVGFTNTSDKVKLHVDLDYNDIYEVLTIPRVVRPRAVPAILTELRSVT